MLPDSISTTSIISVCIFSLQPTVIAYFSNVQFFFIFETIIRNSKRKLKKSYSFSYVQVSRKKRKVSRHVYIIH